MRILLTGSHGLIGSALQATLRSSGCHVVRLVRSPPRPGQAEVYWDPAANRIEAAGLENFDAVVHLAGEDLAGGRWTAARKARIRDSRVRGTRLLSETLARLAHPPKSFLSASAVGFYGSRGDEILTEESPPGSGFLAGVCQEWEAATAPAAQAGIRVAHLRLAMILSARGGALTKMLAPFKLGLGGPLGTGQQYWSWVTLDDVLEAIRHVLGHSRLSGPINFSSIHPVTNREFTRTLGQVLSRPALIPAPAAALRLAFGEMADEALLASARVYPGKLLAAGFSFRFPELHAALEHLLLRG